jgi:hypothetical protein
MSLSAKGGTPRVTELTADSASPYRTGCVSIEHARQQIATYGRDNRWVMQRDALRESANLLTALTKTTYTRQGDNLLLEPKADLKARIGFSPDAFDPLILTFAHPVAIRRPLIPCLMTPGRKLEGSVGEVHSHPY